MRACDSEVPLMGKGLGLSKPRTPIPKKTTSCMLGSREPVCWDLSAAALWGGGGQGTYWLANPIHSGAVGEPGDKAVVLH